MAADIAAQASSHVEANPVPSQPGSEPEEGEKSQHTSESKETLSPQEDVEGYLRETLLGYLRNGIEALLRTSKENGDFAKHVTEQNRSPEEKMIAQMKREEKEEKEKKVALALGTTPNAANALPPPYHPLVWLSDHLRQYSSEPQGRYREMFEQRMAEQRAREEQEDAEESGSEMDD